MKQFAFAHSILYFVETNEIRLCARVYLAVPVYNILDNLCRHRAALVPWIVAIFTVATVNYYNGNCTVKQLFIHRFI